MTKPDVRSIAQHAAEEHAPHAAVGAFIESRSEEDGSQTFMFESRLKGYVGWRWSVNVFEDHKTHEVTISEVLLLPGDDALVAPDWVPWSERLADYKALQAELAAQAAAEAAEAEDGEDSDDDDSDDEDSSDDDIEPQHFTEDEVEAEVEAALELADEQAAEDSDESDSATAADPEPGEDAKGKSNNGRGRFQRRRSRNKPNKK
ncbi:MAG: hypothetical protein RLZZ626_507 [Actinomycetota bacterium]|jgi:hypothetical protein